MVRGKNFNLFLMDGEATGRVKCTLLNWAGIAYKIPRSSLDKCRDRKDLKYSGIYFLFGKNEDNHEEVYVGQAGNRKNGEGILLRVAEHLKDKAYFNEVVVLTTQNNAFGPTDISYLENRFTNLAKDAGRYHVRNGNEPNSGNVTEEKEAELEEFIEQAQDILGVLGYKVFVPIVNQENVQDDRKIGEELTLFLSRLSRKSQQRIRATCKRTSEGFVVLKGSMIETADSPSIPKFVKNLRDTSQVNGNILDGILQKNILFNSPSYASAFVLGMSSNGRTDWKTKDGLTLKELEEQEIADRE